MPLEQKKRNEPLVSVVMPAYNAARYIKEAIDSVLAQTVQDWELIVVDDCSKDDTYQIVQEIASQQPRIRLLRNEVNSGVAKVRNRAMDLARGRYVALLDSDDIWHPEKLEKQIARMERAGAALSYTSYRLITADEKKLIGDYLVPRETSLEDLLGENCIGCSTVLMTGALAAQYRFANSFYHEDYVLWLQMLQQGVKMVGVEEVMVDYRYYPTSRAGNKFASAKYRWEIYRTCMKLPLWKCGLYLWRYALAGVKKYWKGSR